VSRRDADLLLVAATLIWGVTFVVIKDALTTATPLAFLAVRFAVAAVVLTPRTSSQIGTVPAGVVPEPPPAPPVERGPCVRLPFAATAGEAEGEASVAGGGVDSEAGGRPTPKPGPLWVIGGAVVVPDELDAC